MHVLFSIYSLSTGGAERVTATLANHWAEKGWRVTIVTMTGRDQDFYALDDRIKRISLEFARKQGLFTAFTEDLVALLVTCIVFTPLALSIFRDLPRPSIRWPLLFIMCSIQSDGGGWQRFVWLALIAAFYAKRYPGHLR